MMGLETHRMINEDLCCRWMKCVRKLEKKDWNSQKVHSITDQQHDSKGRDCSKKPSSNSTINR
jgi:hypothetical protein